MCDCAIFGLDTKEISLGDYDHRIVGGDVTCQTRAEQVYYCVTCGEIQDGAVPDLEEPEEV